MNLPPPVAPSLPAWARLGAALLILTPAFARGQQGVAGSTGEVASHAETDSAGLDAERNGSVVTANGSAEAKALAAANVISVGWEEIARRRYGSLGDILADVPGLYLVDDLVTPSLGVRGVTAGLRGGTRIVRMMINGIPVNFRPDLTAFLGPEYIPVQMIERVEIAKGPLSALYGANAFVATVNVITRSATAAPLTFEASGEALMHSGHVTPGGTLLGGFNEQDHTLLVSVTAQSLNRSGLSVPRNTFPEQNPTLARYRPFFTGPSQNDFAKPVGIYGQYTVANASLGTLSIQGGYQRLDSMGEFQLNSVLTHESRQVLENTWMSARHERRWSNLVSSNVWVEGSMGGPGSDEKLFLTGRDGTAYHRAFNYRALDVGAELQFDVLSVLQLKAGSDFNDEPQHVLSYSATASRRTAGSLPTTVELVGPGDTLHITLRNVGAYLQALYTPVPDLRITGNLRLDLPSLFAPQTTWRLAAARRWSPAFTTKVIAGRAFQSPSATLLYGLPGFGSSDNVIGNRTLADVVLLQPQTIQSLEAGVSLDLFGRLVLEGAAFGQQLTHQIEFAQVGSNFQPLNQGESDSVGVEVSAQLALGRLSLGGSGEVVRGVAKGQLQADPPALYPGYRVSANANLSLPEAHLNANARAFWVGSRGASQSNVYLNDGVPYTLPAYTRVDLTVASVGLNFLGGAQTTLSLSVKNVLDTRPPEPGFGGFDLPTLGRVTMAELRQTF